MIGRENGERHNERMQEWKTESKQAKLKEYDKRGLKRERMKEKKE